MPLVICLGLLDVEPGQGDLVKHDHTDASLALLLDVKVTGMRFHSVL